VERRRKHNHLRGRHGIDVVAVISSSASGEKAARVVNVPFGILVIDVEWPQNSFVSFFAGNQ
jgi:hypothetical protein